MLRCPPPTSTGVARPTPWICSTWKWRISMDADCLAARPGDRNWRRSAGRPSSLVASESSGPTLGCRSAGRQRHARLREPAVERPLASARDAHRIHWPGRTGAPGGFTLPERSSRLIDRPICDKLVYVQSSGLRLRRSGLRRGPLREIIEHGRTGLLAPLFDTDAQSALRQIGRLARRAGDVVQSEDEEPILSASTRIQAIAGAPIR